GLRRRECHDGRSDHSGGHCYSSWFDIGSCWPICRFGWLRTAWLRIDRRHHRDHAHGIGDAMSGISLLQEVADTAWSVAMAILPLAVLFGAFQIFLLNLPRKQIKGIVIGTFY